MTDIRLALTDKAVARLAPPAEGWYLARDTEIKGFFVVVGKRKKTFAVQGDLRQRGKRVSTLRVSIGDTNEISTRSARATAREYLAQISRGKLPKSDAKEDANPENAAQPTGVTLRQAWKRYHDAHLVRKKRSERTIAYYRDIVERVLAEWLDDTLESLALDPARVAAKHDAITKERGPYIANGSMRTLRAIYRHARKTNRQLPSDNPANAVDWNEEERRNTAMGVADLKGWFLELAAMDNLIRREFHLFTLLSGCRPGALKEAKPNHIDWRGRTLHIPQPKGGSKRAFDIPLSRQMIVCLARVLRLGRHLYPDQARRWLFPADSETGHIEEQKEERTTLSKWGNDLRQTFRTLATAAGVSEFDAKLLMNHAIPGVNAGYLTRHKLLGDHLRTQQQALSNIIFSALGDSPKEDSAIRAWLCPGAARRLIANADASYEMRAVPVIKHETRGGTATNASGAG